MPSGLTAPNRLFDGSLLLERGVDSGRSPALINPNQAAFATNLTMRGGYAKTRPPFVKRTINWPSGVQSLQFQGLAYYNVLGQTPRLAFCASGRQFIIDPVGGSVTEITPDSLSITSQPLVWMLQAERFLIIQDGTSPPIFFDGSRAWRSNASGIGQPHGNPNIPTGTSMAYVQGRIWVAQGNQYTAGDIVYSQQSGNPQYNFSDSILYNTENTFLNGGGAFSVPSGGGNITSLAAVPTLDTSLGQGPMAVFTQTMVFSNDVPTDRTQWQNLSYPAQVVAQIEFGALAQFATVGINGDLFYRSQQGIQSFKIAQRRFADAWGNVPMSREMQRILVNDDQSLLPYASGIFFDNRYLLTCAPKWVPNHGVIFPGIIALDFDILSAMDQLYYPANRLPPAYDGLWTGLNFLRLVNGPFNGVDRCFAAVLNSTNQIEIWEILPTTTSITQDNGSNPIVWSLETKAFDFQNPATIKEAFQIETWVESVIGTITLDWYWRPDKDPTWHAWGAEKELCQSQTVCSSPCSNGPMAQPGYAPRLRWPMPDPIACNTNGGLNNLGYRFQYRLVGMGHCRIAEIRFSTQQRQDDPSGTCDDTTAVCQLLQQCPVNDFSYQIPD